MELDSIQAGGFAFLYESLAQARRSGATFLELPNVYRGLAHGESRLNWAIAFEAVRVLPNGARARV